MKNTLGILIIGFVLASLSSCKLLYPNLMFRQKEYQFFELAQKQIDQYIIQPNDEISLRIFARDGFRLIDVVGSTSINNANGGGGGGGGSSTTLGGGVITYLVDKEGFVRFPVLGEIFVKGYSEKELQRILEDKYASLFVDPFIVVRVENRRVFLFRGSLSAIVPLNNGPTNLFEVIAKGGGLDATSKAYNIKVIRGDIKNPQVMVIDLSTLEGMRKADLIVQSNDIVYIEQKRQNVATTVLGEFTPYLGFVSTVATIIILAKTFGK